MRLNLFALAFLVASTSLEAQTWLPIGSVDAAVPSLESLLGHPPGKAFSDARSVDRVIDGLAAASSRVRVVAYGSSVEGRALRAMVITTPERHARLNEVRAANLRLTDPRTLSASEATKLAESLPAIAWVSAGVHGNESSSPEAALALAWQLAAGTDERTSSILRDAVVIVDPVLNPDGRARYVDWYRRTATDPPSHAWDAAEHAEPWPGGRTNHYFFDLNRDWAWHTQAESRARIEFYRQWMPHTHVDLHEMGPFSTYFFFPAAPPFHQALPPEVAAWGQIYGAANAAALDGVGAAYYVAENFDMFYPGYGDSWPTFNGAIGMTFEQAGGGRAGLAIRRPDGTMLTLLERIRNHFVTSLTTIETTVRRRQERLRDFAAFWRSSIESNDAPRTVLIRTDRDPALGQRLARVLSSNGIEVHRLTSATAISARPYYAARNERTVFGAGTLAISLQQPHRRLATALLESKTAVRDTFFYDLSAWSLPIAYGLPAYESDAALPSSAQRWTRDDTVRGSIVGGPAAVAYLIPWEAHNAASVVWSLLRKDIAVHSATRSFTINGRRFAAGTAVVFASPQRPELHRELAGLVERAGITAYATSTGLSEKGIALGSDRVVPLRAPSIALLTDEPTSSSDVGELWFLLERELGVPFTMLRAEDLGRASLTKYDVMLLPDGGWNSFLDSTKSAALRAWVASGGVLIALEDGARALTRKAAGLTGAELLRDVKDDEKSAETKEREKRQREERRTMTRFEKEEQDRLERIPGAIYRVLVDTTHHLGFGLPGEVFVLKGNGAPFRAVDAGHVAAQFSPDTTAVSGYSSSNRARDVASSPYIQEFGVGRGKVYLFAESATFRMFWLGPSRFLINAMLLGLPPKVY
ncbi:MAG: M14 family metallopeptidase [Bacteroidetes bacterium]|jgi:hypothetical protein|nr:M14 family metallopeptidase [Bacteroidota bacterium]